MNLQDTYLLVVYSKDFQSEKKLLGLCSRVSFFFFDCWLGSRLWRGSGGGSMATQPTE